MDSDRFPAGGARASTDRTPRFAPIGAALAGCLLLAVAASPRYGGAGGGIADANPVGYRGGGHLRPEAVIFLLVPVLATLLGLLFVRRWSYLLLAGGLLGLPTLASERWYSLHIPVVLLEATWMSAPLLLIGVLAAAQALARGGAPGWGAAAAGAAFGSQIVAAALLDNTSIFLGSLVPWHVGMTIVGLAGLVAAASRYRRWDSCTALGPDQTRGWSRPRYVLAGVLAASIPLVLAPVSLPTMARLLGVSYSALSRHGYAVVGIGGMIGIVIAVGSASLAGIWSLAGALTAAGIQLALTAPMLLVLRTLMFRSTLGWSVALLGVMVGVAAAVSRWRVSLAGGAMVLAAASLFLAYAATTGDPEKLIDQRQIVPAALLLVLLAAAGTATVGATVPVLAQRGTVPAVLGPIVAALAIGGRQVLQLTYVGSDGQPDPSVLSPVHHLTTSATLLLVAAAALGGLALAEILATRRADRKMTEAIRREAAEAERNRLARPIHDGVLQVLSLMQRHGPELGGRGAELADLAGLQESALRALINTEPPSSDTGATNDLRHLLTSLATPGVEVSAPAQPVILPAHTAQEVYAAVAAAIDNVRRHAGPPARAWVLVEQEPDGVRVTVRDDGPGIPPGRLDEAAATGRLGVAQSMRGRIADLGGSTVITSNPGEGTEVEFWIPTGRGEPG